MGRGQAQGVGRVQGPDNVEEDGGGEEGEGWCAAVVRGRGLLRGNQNQQTSNRELNSLFC